MSFPGGPTPADIEHQLLHATDNRGPLVVGLSIALSALATVFVALRFWARSLKASKLAIDDYTIIVSMVRNWPRAK